MEENKDKNTAGFNEEEFLKKVEKAAAKGTSRSSFRNIVLSSLPTIIVIALLAVFIVPKVTALHDGLYSFFRFDEKVADKDHTINNYGIFGYKAADFEEAVLGESEKTAKLEVYSQKISDVAEITDTGMFNWAVFSKCQLITYNGTVVYTVDLTKIRATDISLDEATRTVTLKIPHPEKEEININEDDIQFGDTAKGLLAFGEIKLTPEETAEVQKEARARMEEKLKEDDVQSTADRFAILSVWELYSPLIRNVAEDHSLIVEFK